MKIVRLWEMPRKYTFEMSCAADILREHHVNSGWADPFAGYNSPAEFTNDLDTNSPAKFHLEAVEFLSTFQDESLDGVILDPPYSMHQVTVSYGGRGAARVNSLTPVYENAARICKVGGKIISWGWNSNGVGQGRLFQIDEVYLIAHGGHHNDTIVTVERKVCHQLGLI